MRRNRKKSLRKERIVMIASSAFVLAALTMTGVYMRGQNAESQDDGYTLDFASMEEQVEDKYEEIIKKDSVVTEQEPVQDYAQFPGDITIPDNIPMENLEDDLDYLPMEAGSALVEIPGLTEGEYSWADTDIIELEEELPEPVEEQEVSNSNVVVARELHFPGEGGLTRPASEEVLIPFSMEGTVYFATLDQYKYNPAIIYGVAEGTAVSACAEGKVVDVFEDAQIGKAITLDLGDGYQATYGQLKDVQVSVDAYVNSGDILGSVAAPTKYYSMEGSNLYFKLTRDGEPVNPENYF